MKQSSVAPTVGRVRKLSTLLSTLPGVLGIIALLTSGALAEAPQRPYRIGVLNEAWAANHPTVEGLKAGLRDLGLVEGRDVIYEIRFTEGKPEAIPLAAEGLVKAKVDVLFTSQEAATIAAKTATTTIPIVFTLVRDPVAANIVARLAQPGGNVTGVSSRGADLVPKRLEILRTLAPTIRRVWAVYNGADLVGSQGVVAALEVIPHLGLELVPRGVLNQEQLAQVLKELRPGDALLAPDIETLDIPALMLETSLASRIPAIFPTSAWVGYGGLVSYGPDYRAQGIQAARLVAKILRGARPQDLPVESAHRLDLVVNLKTARLFDLPVPRKILLRADSLQR
jgi:putative tryptophan/tyrosine transport system substrate-binding protein